MNTPKSIADLKHYENVYTVDTAAVGIQSEAERVFNANFGDEYMPGSPVIVRYLFTGVDEEGNEVRVYEAYKDSGSVDYVYLTAVI